MSEPEAIDSQAVDDEPHRPHVEDLSQHGTGRSSDSSDVVWHSSSVTRSERTGLSTGSGCIVWFTGLSGSGKSTVAAELERMLVQHGRAAYLLDGDNLRHGLTSDLGFSPEDRNENVRRVGEVAILFADAGLTVLVPLVSPYRSARDAVREKALSENLRFVEVHVATSLDTCERRDTKGLYARARSGDLVGLTGVDDPYEAPLDPELILEAEGESPSVSAGRVLALLDS